jgi:hypothetical protein
LHPRLYPYRLRARPARMSSTGCHISLKPPLQRAARGHVVHLDEHPWVPGVDPPGQVGLRPGRVFHGVGYWAACDGFQQPATCGTATFPLTLRDGVSRRRKEFVLGARNFSSVQCCAESKRVFSGCL